MPDGVSHYHNTGYNYVKGETMFESIEVHKEDIKKLYESGLSIRKVATTLKLKTGTVGAYIKHLGISRNDFRGEGNPFFGKTHSEELKVKHSLRMKNSVPVNKGQCKYGEGIVPRLLINVWETNAKRRGIDFNITADQIDNIWIQQSGKCALTGTTMSNNYSADKFTKVSLDRISNDVGYNIDNVQLVTGIVNITKNILNNTQYLELCRKVVDHGNG